MTDQELELALSALSRGGVVAAATETLFGLLADPRRSGALDRIFELKGRAAPKGVALLLPNRAAWALLVTDVPEVAARLANRFWPGPLTIALPARPELDARITVDGTVAARWPGPSDAARIAAAFGSPLTATSANLSGQSPAATTEDVRSEFASAIAEGQLVLVPGRAPGGQASTLVTVFGDHVHVVRSGAVGQSDLESVVPASAFR
jgi:L-threonylcarbamoyladenylate synthase